MSFDRRSCIYRSGVWCRYWTVPAQEYTEYQIDSLSKLGKDAAITELAFICKASEVAPSSARS